MAKGPSERELAAMRKEAMEFAGLGLYKYALDGTVQFIDKGTVRILELEESHPDPAALIGRNVSELFVYVATPGRVREEVKRRGSIRGEEYEFKTLKGSVKWVLHDSFLIRDEETGEESVQVVIRDITGRKRIEQALRLSEQRYRALFDSMLDGFALWETVKDERGEPVDFRFVEVNPAFEKLTGAAATDLINTTVRGRIPDEELFGVLRMTRVAKTGKSERGTQYTSQLDRHFEGVVFRPWPTHVAAVFADVTERRRLEAQLRQAAKMEAIGTLAGGVAHEINNPVNIIMNYGELIAREVGPENRAAEFAREVITESQRIAEIVKSLLAFARSERETYSQARLSKIVEAAVLLVGKVLSKDQIAIRVDVPAELPQVLYRTQQVQQVVMNLVTNARDALNERYEGYDENKKLLITAREVTVDGEPFVRTTIEDHGTGIAEESLERVFDPFFTTKPPGAGTGLGLSVSHGIVDDHGGRLWVESQLGEWTRFHMDLAAMPERKGLPSQGPTGEERP